MGLQRQRLQIIRVIVVLYTGYRMVICTHCIPFWGGVCSSKAICLHFGIFCLMSMNEVVFKFSKLQKLYNCSKPFICDSIICHCSSWFQFPCIPCPQISPFQCPCPCLPFELICGLFPHNHTPLFLFQLPNFNPVCCLKNTHFFLLLLFFIFNDFFFHLFRGISSFQDHFWVWGFVCCVVGGDSWDSSLELPRLDVFFSLCLGFRAAAPIFFTKKIDLITPNLLLGVATYFLSIRDYKGELLDPLLCQMNFPCFAFIFSYFSASLSYCIERNTPYHLNKAIPFERFSEESTGMLNCLHQPSIRKVRVVNWCHYVMQANPCKMKAIKLAIDLNHHTYWYPDLFIHHPFHFMCKVSTWLLTRGSNHQNPQDNIITHWTALLSFTLVSFALHDQKPIKFIMISILFASIVHPSSSALNSLAPKPWIDIEGHALESTTNDDPNMEPINVISTKKKRNPQKAPYIWIYWGQRSQTIGWRPRWTVA
ncbi:hypothetical protein VP01_763g1 [Puccinia sorghi]|uniref:Uncharacterized protein n=1 Tax=Puccinia sorghi TaxID=27349 RepID=A0A0L6UBR6_9BASI|nr:hypothetical protein VP01_763g1 [Puccinia sorghi]